MHNLIKHFIRTGIVVCISLLCLVNASFAQSGGVKGRVRNMRGDKVAGAAVTARLDGKDVRTATSNNNGEFLLSGLDPGKYNLVFDAKGYGSGIKYGVEVKQGKTVDLGDRLILQVDQGTQVLIRGSVFFKEGTSVTGAKVDMERVNPDGTTKKLGTAFTNIYGEFAFRQAEGAAKLRFTVKYHDATASKEIDVDSAAIYRLAVSLDVSRQEH